MLKLAQTLKENNIKFRWTIFTDLELYGKQPFDLEEITYMKPSYDFMDYIVEADYGVQLSDTEGYSYFINECLQYGTPVICTNFLSAYESVENGINGYIVNMNLNNLDIDKIVNKIPKDFIYKEKCTEKDWIKILNQKIRRGNTMFKVIAKKNYIDTKPECIIQGIKKQNNNGAQITAGDIYFIDDKERAKQIMESGYATVTKEREVTKIETATVKLKAEKAVKRTRKKKK